MNTATASVHSSGGSRWQKVKDMFRPLRVAIALLILLIALVFLYAIFFNRSAAIVEEPVVVAPVPTVVYDSPEERAKEMATCPPDLNPMDMEYMMTTYFDEYKSWLHDKCGADTKLTEVVVEEPFIPSGPLTDEQQQLLQNIVNQALNN